MDNLANRTYGIINGTTPVPGQNCVSSIESVDKLLIIAPSWVTVNRELRWIFLLHTYGFACLFFVLSFYTFFSILNLRSLISSRPFMSTINIFLCLLGASRSGCLFIDPYNLKETMPRVIGSIMWDIGFPCVTSAFCLIQLAFLQLTQLKFGPEKLQKESCLSLIITAHFSGIIASDGVLAFHCNHYMTKYVIQTIFLVWSIMLYLTFLHAGYKVMHLLRTVPNSMLTRDNSHVNQKGIMQLAMLAPYNNLATSVAAALVPTLLGPKLKVSEENNLSGSIARDSELNQSLKAQTISKLPKSPDFGRKEPVVSSIAASIQPPALTQAHQSIPVISTVPEVYVRPPTPTPSTANLPIIMVSSPSRRSSLVSRRGSDISGSSRRNSECSVRFINEEEERSPSTESRRHSEFNIKQSTPTERPRTPEGILRRHSENITPSSSTKDLRRCSDFTHEKNRSSQFATKLRRNSDFGNRTPKRLLLTEEQRLPSVLDHSPAGSRRNSDIGSLTTTKFDSRRNSEFSCRRNSEFFQIKPLIINRRSSDISIRTLDKSPTHYNCIVPERPELQEKSESDSDQPDCNEKAALMNNKPTHNNKEDASKSRKKNLSWKNDKSKEDPEEITAESSLLPDTAAVEGRITGADFTLHSILNHIAYVNRAKSDTPLHIPEADTAAARKMQIQRVLNVTYAVAILGIILCIADIGRIFGPYGLLAETTKSSSRHNPALLPKPWPWLLYQTLCRALELIMGCAMASITKQPSVSPRHQYLNTYPSYSLRMKQRENLYI